MNISSTAVDSSVSVVQHERQSQRMFIDEFVRGHCLPFFLDSGSDISIICLDTVKQLRIPYEPVQKWATSANAAHVKIVGMAHELMAHKVVRGSSAEWLCYSLSSILFIGGSMPPLHIDALQLEDEQPGSLMNVSPQSVITLSSGANPVRVPSCNRSLADEQFIQQEIASLLKRKLIQPSKSPWRAQLHVTMTYRVRNA